MIVEKYFEHLYKLISEDEQRIHFTQNDLILGPEIFSDVFEELGFKEFIQTNLSNPDWKIRATFSIAISRISSERIPKELIEFFRIFLVDPVPQVRILGWSEICGQVLKSFPEEILRIFMKTFFSTPEYGQNIMAVRHLKKQNFEWEYRIARHLLRWDYLENPQENYNYLNEPNTGAMDKWVQMIISFTSKKSTRIREDFLRLCEKLNEQFEMAIVSKKKFTKKLNI
jgi:hypothetical protein